MLHCGDTLTCVTDPRTDELRDRLQRVRQRIETACAATGRLDRPELIVVTKYFPAADVQRLYQLGVRQVGENKDQEAAAKAAHTAIMTAGLNWHFIGQLQSNKAKSVARYASAVHSVDRSKLITALSKAADQALQEGQRTAPLDCLIQVDLREPGVDDGRGGAVPAKVEELAAQIAEATGLQLKGLMAVAPLGEPAEPAFDRLQQLASSLRGAHPEAHWISAGMSQDLEAAVASGATHLRIGRDVLGSRPYPG